MYLALIPGVRALSEKRHKLSSLMDFLQPDVSEESDE